MTDVALEWWDPTLVGPSIARTVGAGLWRYMDGGKRYTFFHLPTAQQEFFDKAGTVDNNFKTALPPNDTRPHYTCSGCPSTTGAA